MRLTGVWQVMYVKPDSQLLLGYFTSSERAAEVVKRATPRPGFVLGEGEFVTAFMPLDQDGWTDESVGAIYSEPI